MNDRIRKRRVLVIGWDGATFDLIDPLLAQDRLPNLARWLANGSRAKLRSCIQPSSEQAWSAFATGKQNGKFGLFGFYQRAPNSYALEYVNASHRRAATLWKILTARGKKSIVVNMPLTWPVETINGALVSGLMTPGLNSQFTYPAALRDELIRALGEYIIDVDIERGDLGNDDAALRELVARVKKMSELQTRAAKYLAEKNPDWDLLTLVYRAPDILCHKFWRYQDPTHPLYNPTDAAKWGNVIADAFVYLDGMLGEWLDAYAHDETSVVVLSDHGFGALTHAVYLNKYFAARGILAYREKSRGARAALQAALRAGVRKLNNPLVGAVKEKVFAWMPQLKGNLHYSMAYGNIDWAHTQAFAVGTMGNVYLNVRGREPNGIVEPNAYEKTRAEIIAALRELRDPETQKPIFDYVYRREEIYHGDALDRAPDVVGVMDGPYHIAAVDWRANARDAVQKVSEANGELLFVSDTSGQHRMDGILVAGGAGVNARASFASQPQLIDLAPTILQWLGEAIPEDMDGRVLDELLEEKREIEFAPAPKVDAPRADGYSEDEAKEIEERLAGLGYLG